MKRILRFLPVFLLLALSSCVEIIDDLSLNADGSGTLKYHVNLSSSKVKINSILALDSLNGQKVPSIPEIKSKINRFVESLKSEEGISNVNVETDFTNFIFKLTCDFTSIEKLQAGMKNVIISFSKKKSIPELDHDWLSFHDNKLLRSVPEITIQKSKEIEDADRALLKQGTYTTITRFQDEIERFENNQARLSANKKAIMIRTDPYSLTQNPHLLDNTIYLKNSND